MVRDILTLPYGDVYFPLNMHPMLPNQSGTIVLHVVEGHVDSQISRQAKLPPDGDKRIAAEHEEMSSIEQDKEIGWISLFLPPGVVAIAPMFVDALELDP